MSDRPSWMGPNAAKANRSTAGARQQTQSYVKSSLPTAPPQQVVGMKFPTIVTVGVAIIATLMLFSVYFWIGIWVIGRINPPEADFGIVFASDYLSTPRVSVAAIASVIATALTWSIGNSIVE